MSSRPKAVTLNVQKMTQRTRALLTALNLHWAGVAISSAICLYLLTSMAFAYQRAKGDDAEAIAAQQAALLTAKVQYQPLEGLDSKLTSATAQADQFYLERLPVSYSEFVAEIGALAKKQGVRLTRVQYAPTQVTGESAGKLTQVQMDAGLTGGYRPLVTFINSLERDKTFFVISNMTLAGQQTGQVNLRVRVATYLRNPLTEAEKKRLTDAGEQTVDGPADTGNRGATPAGVTPMKLGSEDKKKALIAGVAGVLALGALAYTYTSVFGGATPPPRQPPVIVDNSQPTPGKSASAIPTFAAPTPGAGTAQLVGTTSGQLDPTLHEEAMLNAESLVYSGSGRNIFSGVTEAPPVLVKASLPIPAGPARPPQQAYVAPAPPLPCPPNCPPPPPINLKFFGTSTSATGIRKAFLLSGDDVFLAAQDDIVQRKYRVVSISPSTILIEDIPNTNKQSLPLIPN